MTDFNGKLNLLKLRRAGIMQIQGRTGVLRCLVIPVEDNNIFVTTDENNHPKAAYIDLTAWELKNPKYDETHMIKQSLPKEVREKMTDEEKKAIPILGGLKPVIFESQNAASSCAAPIAQTQNSDDLPF
jgi:hypothetical protein